MHAYGELPFGDRRRDVGHFFEVHNHLVEILGEHAYFVVAMDIDRLFEIAGFPDPLRHFDQLIDGLANRFRGEESDADAEKNGDQRTGSGNDGAPCGCRGRGSVRVLERLADTRACVVEDAG